MIRKEYIQVGIRVKCPEPFIDTGSEDMTDQTGTITAVHISQSSIYMVYIRWDNEALHQTNRGLKPWAHPDTHFELLPCPENDAIIGDTQRRQEHADQYL